MSAVAVPVLQVFSTKPSTLMLKQDTAQKALLYHCCLLVHFLLSVVCVHKFGETADMRVCLAMHRTTSWTVRRAVSTRPLPRQKDKKKNSHLLVIPFFLPVMTFMDEAGRTAGGIMASQHSCTDFNRHGIVPLLRQLRLSIHVSKGIGPKEYKLLRLHVFQHSLTKSADRDFVHS